VRATARALNRPGATERIESQINRDYKKGENITGLTRRQEYRLCIAAPNKALAQVSLLALRQEARPEPASHTQQSISNQELNLANTLVIFVPGLSCHIAGG
jgi:hypothetical protein